MMVVLEITTIEEPGVVLELRDELDALNGGDARVGAILGSEELVPLVVVKLELSLVIDDEAREDAAVRLELL
jgi:hypothetical protein